MLAYRLYDAGAVIHTHSQKAVMATLLWPGKEFRCTHLEMIKVTTTDRHHFISIISWEGFKRFCFIFRVFITTGSR